MSKRPLIFRLTFYLTLAILFTLPLVLLSTGQTEPSSWALAMAIVAGTLMVGSLLGWAAHGAQGDKAGRSHLGPRTNHHA